jgi:phenylpropionate dioxygenase-like ring-hydroxylating dioxygenase large terminal subunit
VKKLVRVTNAMQKTWYPIALSHEVGRAPRRVELLGNPYVLYRSRAGEPVVHLDRCPHRNVPLSGGRCREDDTIECPYHGWRFAPDGACKSISGSPSLPKASHAVETFAACELYGLVWMCPHPSGFRPTITPLSVPESRDPSYTTVLRRVAFPGGMQAVIENALDVPHTAVLHRGLFRSGAEGMSVDVIRRRFRTWAEAEFVGERAPQGILGRFLTLGSKKTLREVKLQHWDRFILPGVLQVEYRIGPRSHFLITGFCSPLSPTETTLFALVCLKTPLPKFLERLLVRVIEPFAMKVVGQDISVLRAQTATVEHFGEERFMSTEIDVLGHSIARLLKEGSDKEVEGVNREAEGPPLDTSAVDRTETPREETRLKILV